MLHQIPGPTAAPPDRLDRGIPSRHARFQPRINCIAVPGEYVREKIEACAQCGQGEAPYADLQDGQHYCIRCARAMLIVSGLRPAGRRDDDLTYEDVLFTDLPYSPVLPAGADPDSD